jgi:hypothetical protein
VEHSRVFSDHLKWFRISDFDIEIFFLFPWCLFDLAQGMVGARLFLSESGYISRQDGES